MNWDLYRAVMARADIRPAAKVVAVVLLDAADADGKSWLSRREIARRCALNRATVFRALASLREAGVISVERVPPGGALPNDGVAKREVAICDVSHPAATGVASCNTRGRILQHPCRDPLIDPPVIPKDTPESFRLLWAALKTVRFVVKSGAKKTVEQQVADPALLCEYLLGPDFAGVDHVAELRAAAAWTAERKSQRRDRLGQFLKNWFSRAQKTIHSPDGAVPKWRREL
jgi:hypothetical protein